MPIKCPGCGAEHDVVEFSGESGSPSAGEYGPYVICRCGRKLDLSLLSTANDFLRYFESEEERSKAREIQEDAEVICGMILNDQCPDVDIEIARKELEEKVLEYFPDKMETYRMIYDSRFKRLWDQFRTGGR